MKKQLALIALAASMGACQSLENNSSSTPSLKSNNHSVTIYRDNYGMPHIYSDSNYGVYYGYGYAVAQDRLYQMEMLRRTVLGKVSEVLGEKYFNLDAHIRRSYDLRSVQKQLDAMSKEEREILDAYAAGFNHHINAVLKDRNLMPKEFIDNDFRPSQWTAYDVAMIFAGAIAHRYSDFNSERDNLALWQDLARRHGSDKAWDIFSSSKWLLDNDSPTTVKTQKTITLEDKKPIYLNGLAAMEKTARVTIDQNGRFAGISSDKESDKKFSQLLAKHGMGYSPEFSPASNYWAVGKSKAEGANGILLNGPQFGWSQPSYVYGVALHGGDYDVIGNTLLGLPSLLFAHNNHIAWGSTAGLSDQSDEFILRLNPENADQYWHNGQYKYFETWLERINIKGGKSRNVIARKSAQGMVMVHDDYEKIAVSRARGWDGKELQTLMAWVNLAKQKDIQAARKEVEKVATNINFYYMDVEGNIAYTHAGFYPQRHAGHDSRLPVPGDGQYDWRGVRPHSDNPTVYNPSSGYIANWNNRPARNWEASDLWPYTWSRADRSELLFSILDGQKTFTSDEVWAINQAVSTRDVTLPYFLPYLEQALQSTELNPQAQQALALLKAWDQEWLVDEHGFYPVAGSLLNEWLLQLYQLTFPDDISDKYLYLYQSTGLPSNRLGASMYTSVGSKVILKNLDSFAAGEQPSYDFFNGQDWKLVLRKSFQRALEELTSRYGDDMAAWRTKAPRMDWLDFNFRGVPQAHEEALSVPYYMNRGSENNLFIAKEGGFIAFDSNPPGQSGFVNAQGERSPHYQDQLKMFAEYRTKPLLFDKKELLKTVVDTTVLEFAR